VVEWLHQQPRSKRLACQSQAAQRHALAKLGGSERQIAVAEIGSMPGAVRLDADAARIAPKGWNSDKDEALPAGP